MWVCPPEDVAKLQRTSQAYILNLTFLKVEFFGIPKKIFF